MTHAPAGPDHPLDKSLCGRVIFRGRYLFVAAPECSQCQRILRDIAARLAYLDQVREMFVDSPIGLPAAPSRKGEHEPHIYNSTSATGGGSDA